MSWGKVYLAGPITGLTYGQSVNWREYARKELSKDGIQAFSPMRGKEYLEDAVSSGVFSADGDMYKDVSVMSSNRGIMTRDHFDATTCDVLLVNLLGAKIPSQGTVMEMAWAWDHRHPVVCAMEAQGNPHEHGMVTETIGFRVTSLAAAITIVKGILIPYHTNLKPPEKQAA